MVLSLPVLAAAVALCTAAGAEPGPARGLNTPHASAPAAMLAAVGGDAHPAAVIYHRQQDKGKRYYTVHNGLEIAEARSGGKLIAVEMAHVAAWDPNMTKRPHVEVFWVCVNPASKSCPTPKKRTWFLKQFKAYPASKGALKTGFAITFHAPNGTHNGAFACWNPPKTKGCGAWPGNNKIFRSKGTLIVLHNVNVKTGGRHASKSQLSSYRFESESLKDPVSAQRISYLLCPAGCSSPF